MRHHFVVPALDGPPTGGTLFNRGLVEALRDLGDEVTVTDELAQSDGLVWVDTLFLGAIANGDGAGAVGLLTHYLPALVEHGPAPGIDALSAQERAALARARAFVVPSRYLETELQGLGVDRERTAIVEPGVCADARPGPASSGNAENDIRICVVANLTAGKGVAELLQGLAPLGANNYRLDIVGSEQMDPAYAMLCRSSAQQIGVPVLFHGSVSPSRCMDILRESDLLVSASAMESFGMAIADAQACGIPVLARDAGNVRWLVGPERGGEVANDVEQLAAAAVRLVQDPRELHKRQTQARAMLRTRAWSDVAKEFRVCVSRFSGAV